MASLVFALFAELAVVPAGEAVGGVPFALAMSEKNQLGHWTTVPDGEFSGPRVFLLPDAAMIALNFMECI